MFWFNENITIPPQKTFFFIASSFMLDMDVIAYFLACDSRDPLLSKLPPWGNKVSISMPHPMESGDTWKRFRYARAKPFIPLLSSFSINNHHLRL